MGPFPINIWRAARIALDIVNAQDAIARARPAEARRLMARVAETVQVELPSEEVLAEINLISALVAIHNHEGPLALSASQMALTQLQAGEENWSSADRAYLVAYAQALIGYCEDWRDGGPAIRHANVYGLELRAVSAHLKRRYPLPRGGAFGLNLDQVHP